MADENVNINVDIDVKGDNKLLSAAAKITALDAAAKRLENRTNRLTGAMGKFTMRMTQSEKGVVSFTKKLSLVEKVGARFLKMARMIMFTVIALTIEFGISALSLASVNAAFAIGKFVAKTYNYVMQALAGTIAAVGVAAIGAAAAFKEFQAAQFAFRYKDSKELGSALDQSGSGLRSLYKDSILASMGVQALAGAFTAVSKNSAFTPASKAALKAMADFVSASGDPKNALQAAGTLVGILQKEKKFTAEALQAVKAISPEFEKAFKKGNYKDYRKFLEDLQSGKLALDAGVSGQAGTMSKTLVGQFKTYLASALVEMSDVGVRVLEPIKKAMSEIYFGLERTFRRISGDLVNFGKGPFLSSLVKFTEKLEDFTVVLFRKFLPATEGFWKRTTDFFKGFAIYFREVRDALDPLREGGSIVIKTFGKPIVEIFKQIGEGVKALAQQAKDNKGLFLAFGDAMKSVVVGFFEIMRALREVFAKALPVINPLLSALGRVMSLVARIFGTVAEGGPMLSAGIVGLLGAAAYKGRRAARFQRGMAGRAGGEFGIANMSMKQAIYSGHKFETMANNTTGGGQATLGQFGPISGAMSAAGQAAGAAASAAISPGASALSVAGTSLQGAAASITAAATASAAAVATGNTLRGGFGGGAVRASDGAWTTLPRRKPGQSNADYQRDITRWKMANRGEKTVPLEERGYRAPSLGTTRTAAERAARNDQDTTNIFGRRRGVPTPDYENIGLRQMTREQYRASEQRRRQDARTANNLYYGPPAPMQSSDYRYGLDSRIQESGFFPSGRFAKQPSFRERVAARRARFVSRGGMRGAGGRGIAGLMNFGSTILNGYPMTSTSLGGGGVAGAMASPGTPNSAVRGGLKGLLGRALLGTSYNERGYTGLRQTIRDQAGFAKSGAGSGLIGRSMNAAKGGNFGRGYRNAYQNFLTAKMEGRIPADAKFSKMGGIKAGMKTSFSGANMLAGLGASAFLNSGMGQRMVSDPDAQGALQTGASLAAINPLLGLAVGAGLTAFKSKTKMGGMVAGAVSGAAIGGMIAGPLGAAVGGLVGAGLGALAANRNQKKMAKEAVDKVGVAQLSSIAAAAAGEGTKGSTKNARNLLLKASTLATDFAATRKFDDAGDSAGGIAARTKLLQPYIDSGIIDGNALSLATGDKNQDAISQFKTVSTNLTQALGPKLNQFDSIMNSLQQTTGMTAEEIYTLAMERNVDLYDTTLKLNDATKALGVGMVKTSKQFSDALRDVQIKAMDVFRQFKQSKDMKDALQASGDLLNSGDNSTEAFLDYYTKYLDYSNFKSPNSPLLNAIAQAQAFGTGANLGKGTLFGPGGVLEGSVMNTETTSLIGQAQTQTASGSATEMTKQLLAMAGEAGFSFADGEKAFSGSQSAINQLITAAMGGDADATAKVRNLEGMLSRGVAFKGKSASEINNIIASALGVQTTKTGRGGRGGATGLFGTNLTAELSGQLDPFKDILTEEAALMRTEFTQAIRAEFFDRTDTPDWWDQAPSWWTNGFEAQIDANGNISKLVPIGDTKTSKILGKTMAKHSMFNSAVPGNRTVTSSLRDFALGSNNSDHATGHAYDLVGDNLNKYSSLVNAAGGFAEFHGRGSGRHLHVVPPVGPMGDTSSGILAKMTGSTSGGGGANTFNITVNESATPQVTAQAVANEIIKIQKNIKQRI